jgi:hypothetical protein
VGHAGNVDKILEIVMEAETLVFMDLRAVLEVEVGVDDGADGDIHRRPSEREGVKGETIVARLWATATCIRKDEATLI